jgi:cytochrome c-type biogenesis protein CcmF
MLMGIGPSVAWKRSSPRQLLRTFAFPFLGALVVALALVLAGIVEFYPVLAYALCFFGLMTIIGEVSRGLGAQRSITHAPTWAPSNIATLWRRQRVKYGAHIIHFGVLVMTVSITASMAHKIEREFTLAPGQRFNVGRFSLELNEFHEERAPNYDSVQAHVSLRSLTDEKVLQVLAPEMRFYRKNKETTTEVALRMGQREDVYLVLAGIDESGSKASMKVFINPLQVWLWYGAIVLVIGGVVVAVPMPRSSNATISAREGAAHSI